MPFSVGVGLATSILAKPAEGWQSTFEAVQTGDYIGAFDAFVRSWTGVYGLSGREQVGINVMGLINPFSPEAPALKAMLWTGVATKIAKVFVKGDPFSKVPFLGKYVKFA